MTIFFYKGLIRILEMGREDLNFKLRFHFKTLSRNWYPKTIFFHKELTRNWEIRLGSLSFVSNQILLNAENCRVTALPFSGLLSKKNRGRENYPPNPLPPTQCRVNNIFIQSTNTKNTNCQKTLENIQSATILPSRVIR